MSDLSYLGGIGSFIGKDFFDIDGEIVKLRVAYSKESSEISVSGGVQIFSFDCSFDVAYNIASETMKSFGMYGDKGGFVWTSIGFAPLNIGAGYAPTSFWDSQE